MICGILNNTTVSFNGKFAMMSIDRNFLYQMTYVNNKRESHSTLHTASPTESKQIREFGVVRSSGELTIQTNGAEKAGNAVVCTDWWLVATYSDGTEIWMYLDTTCVDGPCNTTGTRSARC